MRTNDAVACQRDPGEGFAFDAYEESRSSSPPWCRLGVTGLYKKQHRHQEFLAFLKHVARAYPDVELHLVMDNYTTHKQATVKAWLAANPRIHVHFTPTSGSWLNMVEVWFGIIERQAIHRGSFPSARDLMIKIRQFITGWNRRKHPFIWTKPAADALAKIDRKRKHVSITRH